MVGRLQGNIREFWGSCFQNKEYYIYREHSVRSCAEAGDASWARNLLELPLEDQAHVSPPSVCWASDELLQRMLRWGGDLRRSIASRVQLEKGSWSPKQHIGRPLPTLPSETEKIYIYESIYHTYIIQCNTILIWKFVVTVTHTGRLSAVAWKCFCICRGCIHCKLLVLW